MAFTPFSAKRGKVRVAGSTVTAKSWNVVPEVDEIDTTNFEGDGFYEWIAGIKKLTITIEFDTDSQANHFAAPLGLTAGAAVSSLALYWQNTSGPFWDITLARVKTVPNTNNVKEANKNTITLIGSGAFVYPAGTFTPS